MLIGSVQKFKRTTAELNILLNNQNIIQVDHYTCTYLAIWLDTIWYTH